MNDLSEYFRGLVNSTESARSLGAPVVEYIIQRLLIRPPLGDSAGMPVLTWMHRDALEKMGHARSEAYRTLGDTALYFSGVFPSYVLATGVGLEFFIDMGKNAYTQALCDVKDATVIRKLIVEFHTAVFTLNAAFATTTLHESDADCAVKQLYAQHSQSEFRRAMLNNTRISKRTST